MKTHFESPVETEKPHRHPDPITGEPGAHPLGAGVGALGGGLAGAAIGALGGPLGVVIGTAAGSFAGGLLGREIAESADPLDRVVEAISPQEEEDYWRQQHRLEPYFDPAMTFADYAPAYRLGYETRDLQGEPLSDAVEAALSSRWEEAKGDSRLSWQQAKPAIFAVWQRWSFPTPPDDALRYAQPM